MADINSAFNEDPRLNGRSGFGRSVIEYIEAMAGRREAALGVPTNWPKRQVEALERLAYSLPQFDEIRDRRWAILFDVNSGFAEVRRLKLVWETGNVPSDAIGVTAGKFEKPSPMQSKILGTLGDSLHPAPPPDQTLDDLAMAGVRDLVTELGNLAGRERSNAVGLAKELKMVTAQLEQNRVDRAALQDITTERDSAMAQIAEKDKLIAELREMVQQEPEKPPRRRMIEHAIYRAKSGGLEVAKPGGGFVSAVSLAAARSLRDEMRADDQGTSTEASEEKALKAALDAKEAEVGHELSEDEIGAVRDEVADSNLVSELSASSAPAAGGGD
jgi:hypothetical protein